MNNSLYNFYMNIPLASTGLRQKDIEAAISVMNSGKLTIGDKVSEFENAMANYLNVKHFIMVNSGSSANLAIFEAAMRPAVGPARLKKGDGVLVPIIAWPTTIWPVIQLGLEPIFIDIEENNLGIDLKKAEEVLKNTENVRAIFPIHPLGRALDGIELRAFADKNHLVLFNDVCESLGSFSNGAHAGTSGLASSFSFYFSHHITTMEGGGIATDDDLFANDLKSIRSHGWSRGRGDADKWLVGVSSSDSKFRFVTTGFNIRPMEIQAAIGIKQLEDLPIFIERRREIAKTLTLKLKTKKFKLIGSECFSGKYQENSNSWMLLPIRITDSSLSKTEVTNYLESLGIETRPILTGNFLDQPAMNRIDPMHISARDFKIADLVSDNSFLVGAHHDLTNEQVEFLATTLNGI